MKNVNIIVIAILLIAIPGICSHAQNFSLGIRGGISIPNLTAGGSNQNPLNTGYGSRLGPDFGISGEYKVSNLFSIEAMAQYSSQGGKKDGMQALVTPGELAAMFPPGQSPVFLYANYKSEAKFNYLLIPILAKFGWDLGTSPWRVYLAAGPFAGFLLSASQVTSGQSALYLDAAGQQPLPAGPQSFDNTQDIKSQLKGFNFGLEGNVGISYRVGSGAIFIEGGGNYGFINIQKNTLDGSNNTGAGTIDIGYQHWLQCQTKKTDQKSPQ
jgi:hypothetical protein